MEMAWETKLNQDGSFYECGQAKLAGIQTWFSNSGLRGLQVYVSLNIPILSQPVQPKISANQRLELTTSNFIYGAQCNIHFASGEIATLRNLGGKDMQRITLRGEISGETIQYIEDYRRGSDVNFHLDFQVLLEQRAWWSVIQGNGTKAIPGFTSNQISLTAHWDSVKIAASDWINEFLPSLRYDGPFYIEIPRLHSNLLYGSAKQHMEQAMNCLKTGGASYRSVPGYCLNALDALSKTFGYENFSSSPELYPNSNTPERKAVIQKFKNYINRWRHDQTGKGSSVESLPLIEYEEAMFIYVATSYLIQLMAKLTPQNI